MEIGRLDGQLSVRSEPLYITRFAPKRVNVNALMVALGEVRTLTP